MSNEGAAFVRACDYIASFQTEHLSDLKRLTRGGFEVRKNILEKYWSAVEDAYEKLFQPEITFEKDEPKLSELTKKYKTVFSIYLEIGAFLFDELEKFRQPTSANTTEANYSVFGQSQTVISEQKEFRLPAIKINKFSGDYKTWRSFHDLFKSLIMDNQKLKPVEKFYYLLGNLEGAPKDLVSKYPLEDSSFDVAWSTLKKEYDNLRVLVNAQLKELFSLPTTKTESPQSIKLIQTTVNDVLAGLQSLKVPTEGWDPILVYIVTKRLPTESHTLWEHSLGSNLNLPKWTELDSFLQTRYRTLEAVSETRPINSPSNQISPKMQKYQPPQKRVNYLHSNLHNVCKYCKESPHFLKACNKFLALDVSNRQSVVKSLKVCVNCLAPHRLFDCKSKFTCGQCKRKHHTLLHFQSINKRLNLDQNEELSDDENPSTSTATVQANSVSVRHKKVLLSTALVNIKWNDQIFTLRALIDSGSEATFILDSAVKRMRIPTQKDSVIITGMGSKSTATASKAVNLIIAPKNISETIETRALVLKKLTGALPSEEIVVQNLPEFKNLVLADPFFNQPGKIELVIGADIYSKILKGGISKVSSNITAIDTVFGHILIGVIETEKDPKTVISMFNSVSIDEQIRKFWEMEEIATERPLSEEDKYVESFYTSTHFRRADGRYVVKLPFIQDYPTKTNLSYSRELACKRFEYTERKFNRNPDYKLLYSKVIHEYLDLHHMQKTDCFEKCTQDNNTKHVVSYYMPHHGVLKENSLTTKLRVVFDCSSLTNNKVSLNNVLYTGPALQNDLTMVILRSRRFPFVFNADITMMYRQILVNEEHIDFQRIVYRECTDSPVQDYAIKVVTFGMSCSPYLAIRTLHQLADDENKRFPLATPIVKNDFYVDDLLSGAYTVEEARENRDQVANMLLAGGFELRKWCSNSSDLLSDIPKEHLTSTLFSEFSEENCSKTLGVLWNNKLDYFTFRVSQQKIYPPFTKRKIFSEISKLFDPAGWLGPVIVKAKILIQTIWSDHTDWDEEVKVERAKEWELFFNDLINVEKIKINRWLDILPSRTIELHGFADASTKAMCCCIYARVFLESNEISVNLITAKTKVAPLKTISLPRLELCAAVMLSKLLFKVKTALEFQHCKVTAWSDSTIALAWINSKSPSKWKTFVANRLTSIYTNVGYIDWKFVRTDINVADPGSRGLMPSELINHPSWFTGPDFLKFPDLQWSNFQNNQRQETFLEIKSVKSFSSTINISEFIFDRFSSFDKGIRVLTYCFRFISKLRKNYDNPSNSLISPSEFSVTKNRVFKTTQMLYFPEEYKDLKANRSVSKNSLIASLNPFLDEHEVIRINGRISNLPGKFSEKYPIILPYKAHITTLLLENYHKLTLHGNIQLMATLIRKQFWINRLKQKLKTIVHNCKNCFLQKKQIMGQLMGALPINRISISRPFTHIGVDFGGPLTIKLYKGRCNKFSKGYICLFVCFATKAIHLEAVSSLEGQAFLDAFRRFYCRRGLPSTVFLDNAGNHIAVANYFSKEYKLAFKNAIDEAAKFCASRQITWEFNCPLASHRAGLAEAGIKSVKYHLRRTVGAHTITFEELTTILTQIESCLNSRPLMRLSDNAESFNILTPGHFLIGDALLSPPEPSLEAETINDLRRLDLLTKIKNDFWKKWKEEYLHTLQNRTKWRFPSENIKVNEMVVIKNENTPPQVWPLGRVLEVFKNSDSRVRICKVKTQTGTFLRPITKLCLLPLQRDAEAN